MTSGSGRRARGEGGDTLIEVLVTIVIVGLTGLVVVGVLGASITLSAVQRNTSTMDALLRSSAEMVTSDAYQPCATSTSYALPGAPQTNGFTVNITHFGYWNPTTNQFDPSCTPGSDSGLQMVEITVASNTTHQGVTGTLQVVKRG